MKILNLFIGDQTKAKLNNTTFYIKQFSILAIKAAFVLSSIAFLLFFVFLLFTPDPTKITMKPSFEVKKMNDNHMIILYANSLTKEQFCENLTSPYHGKFYTKQQFCQVQHEYFPFSPVNQIQVDVFAKNINSNVQYITGCLVKIQEPNSVCQKFAYSPEMQIFNNLELQDLYSIEIQMTLKKSNQYFGSPQIQFKQQNSFIVRIVKQYYFIVSTILNIIISLILTGSFVIIQIPQILQKRQKDQKAEKAEKKIKAN